MKDSHVSGVQYSEMGKGLATGIPTSPVDIELTRIDSALDALDTALGNLRSRIGPALEPEGGAAPESPLSEIRAVERSWLHGTLRTKADKIESLAAAVNALRDRVTL